jgi:hypothetical protein
MVFEGVRNTYTKGPMYCLRLGGGVTLKWPLVGIFNTREEKGFTSQEKPKKKPYTIEMEPTKTEPAVTKETMPAVVWARIYFDGSGRVYNTEEAAAEKEAWYDNDGILLRITKNCALSKGDDALWCKLVHRLCKLRDAAREGQKPPVTKIVV